MACSVKPKSAFRRSVLVAGLFSAAYLAAAVVGALSSGNQEFVFYIVVMLVLFALAALVHSQVDFSDGVVWGLSAWGALHMAGGLVAVPENWSISGDIRVLYSWWLIPGWLKYDQIVHAFGFGVTAVACWQVLRVSIGSVAAKPRDQIRPTFGLLVLCWAAALGFGALNEVVEFIATLLVPSTNVGGYVNTGWDLVANSVGAALAILGIAWQASRCRSHHDASA
jgi:hypothetical protein